VCGTSDEDPVAEPLQFGGRQCPQFLNISVHINTFMAEREKYEYVTFSFL
jgi:hypothetical protein